MRTVTRDSVLDLAGVDWQKAWELEESRKARPEDASRWTGRSKSYGLESLGEYESEFLARAGIVPGETVLDFGCGTGLLAVPLAKAGCKVVACDFSAGMLEALAANAAAAGVSDRIEAHLLAWDGDWEAEGILPESVDVAIASRSIATRNLLDALVKLDRAARRRVCVTVAAGRSPRRDERAFEAVGRPRPHSVDYAYCMNVLFQHGAYPELSYIVTHSRPAFADRDAAVVSLADMLGGGLTEDEAARLDAFVDGHYAFDPEAHPARAFAADELREVRWAYISW